MSAVEWVLVALIIAILAAVGVVLHSQRVAQCEVALAMADTRADSLMVALHFNACRTHVLTHDSAVRP